MKKLVKLLMVACMTAALVGCSSGGETDRLEQIKKQGYITLGTSPDYAPNEFYIEENGKKKVVGSDIDMAQAIADKIGVELRIQESDFNTVIANVQAGNVDMGISGFAWKSERAEVVDFSDNYSRDTGETSWQGLMVRKEDAEKFKTKEDVKNAKIKIGAQTGSIQYDMALAVVANKSDIVAVADTTSCAGLLSTGDIDAFVCTSTQAYALMETFNNITILPEKEFNMDPDEFYDRTGVIVAKGDSSKALLEVINEVIEEAKVKDENGLDNLTKWYENAVKLMPFEIPEDQINQLETAE
ncbi:transporter substrate-binding domain-containing protein [Beduini massiliensis]|uniref:transporter substrate-binding domain-containing protein n=1 Tax=Beduini massiliensis TaxID=1585974 RepID=UPI00069505D2|nr:transporter substrate-binding domain-containing protein [Beduini massiliensis]